MVLVITPPSPWSTSLGRFPVGVASQLRPLDS